ncbi:lipoprotein insertase outer membrane protein LolB, partial [Stenotrophomonas sp. 3diitr2024]|uniref:lipoprotein insertase outer membrane protein LolB n=1 Tax=Stenotrophomonas sp. 3diitr2024 TaxID=3345115 RepID=UPI0035C9AD91
PFSPRELVARVRARLRRAAPVAAAPGADAGWQVQYLDWYPADAGRPALPRRIEASNGDAKVRLLVDEWGQGTP